MIRITTNTLAALVLALCFSPLASSKSIVYEGSGEETWTHKGLDAGDIVIIPDGTYHDLKINVQGRGEQSKPIILRAQTPGKVVLTGASWIRYWGYYIVVDGFDFQDVNYSTYKNKIRPIIANRRAGSSSGESKDMCKACVLQRVRIDNETPEGAQNEYKWIEIYGYNNVIRYNYFGAKKSDSRVLQVQLKHANNEELPVSHLITRNYFASRNAGKTIGNGGEALLIGESKMQHVVAKVLVENNLFYDAAIKGEPEVISNKSSDNTFRHNTIRNTSAGLTLRHGDKNTVAYNWFFQAGEEGTAGIRMIGDDNQAINNYMDSVAGGGKSSPYRPALGLPAAYSKKDDEANINGYQLSERPVIKNNTVIRSAQPVMLSTWYDRGKLSMTRPPKQITFVDNLVFQMDVQPSDANWVKGLAISADFNPESEYGNEHGTDKAEYAPSFTSIKGNITDGRVSPALKNGITENSKKTLTGCDAFGTGDMVYEQLDGAGADLSLMTAPLVWSDKVKSPRLGPDWLNPNWNDNPKTYTPCE
ncbi:polysaccharide lyase 6 family protein [Gilvimarinus agarilyticus]|uniref:polysaccharide lyase 6 family protein n=1 Tax=unclassified Gilvimarinus TaxID=2642066 RepID=UPI001C0857A2|nr:MULTISPECIES: polysaccharide lyase 6 family protein [unclassified Gilvimarinus]MBU2885517.1 polysaccharide lyase 6 family protein [Gilvimarinus agarilyticus]MDO6570416.1 polysaccharide lyase 6 family protein [Gilvimarinus sp. 2_MG-2023]MDO6748402.1 polysaccharide lyase 6 family protein [Gilvimarinus sp. 1_MG-2023]